MSLARIIGHARQVSLLRSAMRNNSVGPAYLFFGPRGVGKMTVAMEFARALLCTSAEDDACDRCDSCRRAGTGASGDLFVAAPEKKVLKIEQVRDLQSFLSLTPAEGGRKVALVDSAEALNREAANALLKTLEEPPGPTVVLLVSSNLGALPATVVSRCRKVNFGFLSETEVVEVLDRLGWAPGDAARGAALAEGCPGAVLALEEEAWKRAGIELERFVEAVRSREGGRLAELVESLPQERSAGELMTGMLLGEVRREIRRRLGLVKGERRHRSTDLSWMERDQLDRLATRLLETSRLLEGNVNVKLALGDLFTGWSRASSTARHDGREHPPEDIRDR